jgi:hypothetical protein
MSKRLLLASLLVVALVGSASVAYSQQRIGKAVVINGEQVSGVTVTQNGVAQSYSCPSPQPYVTADGTSSGWACYDQGTGTWLLNAVQPQQSTNIYTEPPTYSESPDVYDYDYDTPYGYDYPGYGFYPYYSAPFFGFGFRGGEGHFENHAFEHHRGNFNGGFSHENGGFSRGPAVRGFAPHGGGFGGHGGGGHVGGGGMGGGGHR